MKFLIILWGDNVYKIILTEKVNDENIAQYLDLNLKRYQKILKLHNAYRPRKYVNFYFKNKKDAEDAIEELEPYLMMAKLVGG